MCGFVAIYKNSEKPLSPNTLEAMTNTLVHRGPDDYGFVFINRDNSSFWKSSRPEAMTGPGVALGHRRLSILDLSDAGRQPFSSNDKQFWIAYNGEIYNYVEIREELKGSGFRFDTSTDTEVLLAAYQHWGVECFNRFNGMWSLVIWDNYRKQLVACRDRFGIKPLYSCRIGNDWFFASEIKALLQHPDINPQPDSSSVFNFLFGDGMPDPGNTFFSGINEIRPGQYITLTQGKCINSCYWKLPRTFIKRRRTPDSAAEELFSLLGDAVKLRLRSDVKVGTMLSGGLDSTSVISLIKRLLDSNSDARRVVGDQLHAFNAGFPGLSIDENRNVTEISDKLDLAAHIVYPMDEDDALDLFDTANFHMEAPFHNSVPMVHTLLMKKARSTGVKVVLNGHGADELFAGYPSEYSSPALYDMLTGLRWGQAYHQINGYHRNYGLGRKKVLLRAFNKSLPDWNRLSSNYKIDPIYPPDMVREHQNPPGKMPLMNRLEQRLRADFSRAILPRWLHMEDKISMASSIEARLPFLDYRIVEFAFSLDNSLKIRNGTTKYVLRKAMHNFLPGKILQDNRKLPFSGPERFWLTGSLKDTLVSSFLTSTPLVGDYLNNGALREKISGYISGESPTTNDRQIWRIFNTEMWLRKYF